MQKRSQQLVLVSFFYAHRQICLGLQKLGRGREKSVQKLLPTEEIGAKTVSNRRDLSRE